MILRGKKTMLDRKFPHSNLEHLELSYFFYHWRRVRLVSTVFSGLMFMDHVFCFPYSSISSTIDGLQPALRGLCLHRVIVEWVLRPKILLPEPNDVVLFQLAIPIESFVFGDKILVSASGDRSDNTAHIHLGAAVEQVRHVLDANPVAHLEGGFGSGILRFFQRLTF